MFVNYFKAVHRDSSVNLMIARVLLSVFAIWKLLSYDFTKLREWPFFLFDRYYQFVLLSPSILKFLWIEVVVVFILLIMLLIGYRIKIVTFFSALILTHLVSIHYVVTNSGLTWLPIIYFLLIFALYSETDRTSIDSFLRLKKLKGVQLSKLLKADPERASHIILTFFLVITALIYFFTGFSKLRYVGVEWMTSSYVNRLLFRERFFHLNDMLPVSTLIVNSSFLGYITGIFTIALEVGFIFCVLLKRNITVFVLGLATMHLMILLTMEIFFFDQFILYLLFIPWDVLIKRVGNGDRIEVVYDTSCQFCVSALYVLKSIDVRRQLKFFTPHEKPLIVEEVDDSAAANRIYIQIQGVRFTGFYAFRRLWKEFWYFFPLYPIFYLKPMEKVGVKIFTRIANNQHFISESKVV